MIHPAFTSRFVYLCLSVCLFLPVRAQAEKKADPVLVAAASDLKFALDEVIAGYEKANPGQVIKPTYGSSGTLFAQIDNGAPFDLFLSADVKFARQLAEKGKAEKDSVFLYAVGHLVLWVPKDSPIDVEHLGMESLRNASIQHVAIANPEHAPYGAAALAALKSYQLYPEIKDRLVLGENVAQTAQFVSTGAADIGIIALSLAVAPPMKSSGKYWTIPLDKFPRLEQGGVIVSGQKNPAGALQFKKWLTAPEGHAVLRKYGFLLPGADK